MISYLFLQILAPTDEAFENIRGQIAGPGKDPVSMEYLLELPELRDIILYHILPGAWTSEYLKNNTAIPTTKLAEIVPMSDGAMTEGVLMLHDSCVDKPTPDAITCDDQALFGKCYDPFMVSPLGAQWQGGFCQRSCGRCTCDPTQGTYCAEVRGLKKNFNFSLYTTMFLFRFSPEAESEFSCFN